jgi:hypothetical protein
MNLALQASIFSCMLDVFPLDLLWASLLSTVYSNNKLFSPYIVISSRYRVQV